MKDNVKSLRLHQKNRKVFLHVMEQTICPVLEERTQMYENTKQSVLPRSVLSQLKLRILFGVIYRFAANALNEKKKWKFRFWMWTVPWNCSVNVYISQIYFPTISDFTELTCISFVRQYFLCLRHLSAMVYFYFYD